MKKRSISFVIVLAFIVMTSTIFSKNASAQTFTDVKPKDPYYEAVESLAEQGVISTASGKFNPNNNITRGQLAKMLATTLDLNLKNVKNPKFKDVPITHEFYPYIAALANKGIISGYPDGTFGVNKLVKKSHLAKFIVNGFELPIRAQYKQTTKDVKPGTETDKYVATLYFYNIEKQEKYNPNSNAKRQIVARYIYNTIQNKNMIDNQKAIKYPTVMKGKSQQFFTFSTTKNIGKADYLSNSFVLLPTEEERGMYLPFDNQFDKKVQFEVNEKGEVVHLSLVAEFEPQYKNNYSFASTNYEHLPGVYVEEAKYENYLNPNLQPIFGERALEVYPRWSREVLKVNDMYAIVGDALFTDMYKETLTLSDGQQIVKYYEMDEYDFEVFANELTPITTEGYYASSALLKEGVPYNVEGPTTYEYKEDAIFDENFNYVSGPGFYFKGVGTYKVIQDNKTLIAVEVKIVNGQLFGKFLDGETVNSMVTTYDDLY
ncbi:MAG: S-layer homology domain-containing protein [Lysinibacillus sp.]